MKFILTLSNWVKDWNAVKELSQLADSLNFWGLGMPDHYLWTEGRDHTLESWIALTNLASITKNIHVGTIVSPIALRPPTILAKMVSTVDVLSGGRSFLGVGAGWSQREFETYSEWNEPKVRVNKTIEGLKLIKTMWKDEKINFEGNFYNVKNGVLEPKPVQKPHPPILFGGFGPRMLKLAGKYADIVFIPPWRYENFTDGKNLVLQSTTEDRKANIKFASASPADKERHYAPVEFTLPTYFNCVELAEKEGCDYFIFSLPEKYMAESLNLFAKDIIPSFQ